MTGPRDQEHPTHDEGRGYPPSRDEVSQRLALLPESMNEYAIFSLDAEGRVQSWNANAERVEGYSTVDIIGRHFSVFYPSEQIATGYPDWELERAAEVGFYIDEGWRLRKDGSRFLAHVVITVQRTPEGMLSGFIKVVRDITEARERERRSRRRFTDLFHLAPVGICVLDDSERLLDANSALCDLLGYGLSEIHGKTAADLLHPRDGDGGFIPATTEPGVSPDRGDASQRVLARSDGQQVICDVHSTLSVQEDGSRFWLVGIQDISERIRHTEELHYQATHDDLTGLLNRKGLSELLEELRGGPTGRFAGLYCDIDNFKRVNDSLGHEAGDELLMSLARRLRGGLPEQCTAARLSGDEFLIVCSDIDAVGGLEAFATWAAEFLNTAMPMRGEIVRVSASVGAAMLDPATMTAEDLMRLADAAMLKAKSGGAGRTSLADSREVAALSEQVRLEEELRQAIDNDGLALRYQPLVDRHGTVVMAEALLRWPHPERGQLAPDVIIPVAEQGDLLRSLDLWVLRTAMREAAGWPQSNGGPVNIAVNLGGLLPADPSFVDEIRAVVTDSDLDWHRVILEVLETVLVDLPEQPREAMTELSEKGVRFAMDDFGIGYSSLARLNELPTQIIKLDRRFVSRLDTSAADYAIARAVVDMARAMGRACVAEGVETATQFRLLDGLGVDVFQGFLFSRPLPPAELRALLDSGPLPVPAGE
ncbi:diguanylate cyclase (GGDEF)-like protein/PAS domain S-box-containing protein [Saccharopolyspora lacisalsi]|uniref:Diguanylate cyclase (GGDEF)-like protein/PAS domain S-box-containing protein n=1 Tax=Halosaccharopolyspora lacisalsi TaxID=1000566 RepID=A0A839E4T8_9PSEU|nr:bifunctional diguanylate cyclase/phosphodiesterase [Halosaccharopolyspora lacisalsi]MBA8825928.1 diguanylate cyclase (GGDEF)-like protein/PAS domain S-box-containing protein [Halosaccharopolyspora lacisalsi]